MNAPPQSAPPPASTRAVSTSWALGSSAPSARGRRPTPPAPSTYVCVSDHFEPRWRRPSLDEGRRRVGRWVEEYPKLARRHADSFGRSPVRTLFFPWREYRPEHLDAIASVARDGLFDVQSTSTTKTTPPTTSAARSPTSPARSTRATDSWARPVADRADHLGLHPRQLGARQPHPDGIFCGVDDELSVLVEAGCYADLTLPCVPSPARGAWSTGVLRARAGTTSRL